MPKSRESLPVAQFCAITGVLPENGTEFSIRGEVDVLVIKLELEPASQALCQNRVNRFLWHNFVP